MEGLLKKMNIELPTSNVEWEKMKKQTYDLEERLLKKPNIPSFHYCIFPRLRRMSEPN